jgi:cyclophilin family peptidyl-prolyl cis-trans isomerase
MKRIICLFFVVIAATFTSCKDDHSKLADGLYAEIETSKGIILLELEYQKAPITVANFVTLAEGTNTLVTQDYKGKPFFDGLKFHRVVPDFVIQGGDPLGNGSGDAGYNFIDEITDLNFDEGGTLAMANSGPGTNSCQFFITHVATPNLYGKHTVFGHVIENGMEVVNAIVQDDAINSISIIRKGEAAKKFNAVKVFTDYFNKSGNPQKAATQVNAENVKKATTDKLAFFAEKKASATKSSTGLLYNVYEKGAGRKSANGTTVFIAYSGFLEDGTLFDSSDVELSKAFGKFNPQKEAQNMYQPLPYTIGSKGGFVPGFEEGLSKMNVGDKAVIFIPSNLGYGENGAGNVIPPNANIIFEVQMLEKQ